jgi:hypothetical protein
VCFEGRSISFMAVKKRIENNFVQHLYQQSELFDNHIPEFDEKLVVYKINDKIYI